MKNIVRQDFIHRLCDLGFDCDKYDLNNYDTEQIRFLWIGLRDDVDISFYNDPKIPWYQMKAVKNGLSAGIEVSLYNQPGLSWDSIREIYWKLLEEKR